MTDNPTTLEMQRALDHANFDAYIARTEALAAEYDAAQNALALEASRREFPWSVAFFVCAMMCVAMWVLGFLVGWGTVAWTLIKSALGW